MTLRQMSAAWDGVARALALDEERLASGDVAPVDVDKVKYTLTEYTRRELLHEDDYVGCEDEDAEEQMELAAILEFEAEVAANVDTDEQGTGIFRGRTSPATQSTMIGGPQLSLLGTGGSRPRTVYTIFT